ncbi:MAG TPA: hypothetical protein VFC65_03470 [Prolixibacteraceae bacterium]|nr:hypothetical protein [Prolixibacteraceae bacterium]
MTFENTRSYNCKNEELPVIGGFVATSLTRDRNDFGTYSPMFDQPYLDGYKAKIELVQELVEPKSETVELKLITERMYSTLDGLVSPANYVSGYLDLAGKTIPINETDFGLVQLRKSARNRDVENVLSKLRTVEANIKRYQVELNAKGLTEALTQKFTDAGTLLAEDKNKKYALISNRTALVQNNLGVLNDLNEQLTEICNIGKILYKQTNPAKLKDYTFTQLIKKVRRVDKPEEAKPVLKAEESPAAE